MPVTPVEKKDELPFALGLGIKLLRENRGLSRYKLGKLTGLTGDQLRKLEDGRNRNPELKTVQKIAEALSVRAEDLFRPYSFARLGASTKREGAADLAATGSEHDPPRDEHTVRVPIETVSVGGAPQESPTGLDEDYRLQAHLWGRERKVIRIFGESMAPEIRSGDLLLIDTKKKNLRSGDIAWFLADGGTTVKKYVRERGEVKLVPTNPLFPSRIVSADSPVEVLGTALGIVWRAL